MAELKVKCDKCGGNVINDHGREYCLACGKDYSSPKKRRIWYQNHKEEMIKDLLKLGTQKVIAKWNVNCQQVSHLKHDRIYFQLTGQPAAAAPPTDNHLPPLPAFSNEWAPEVQVKWLEVWGVRR